MLSIRKVAPVVTLFCCLSLTACDFTADQSEKDAEKSFGKIIQNIGYTPELPPTTLVRPGLVFAVEQDSGGLKFRRVVCPDIANGAALITNTQVPITATGSATFSGSVGVSLTETWLKILGDAGLQAAANSVTKVTFTPTGPKTEQMADIPSGSSTRVIPSSCLPQLQSVFDPQTGKPKYPVYIVIDALSYSKLTASYEGSGGVNFAAKLTSSLTASKTASTNPTNANSSSGNAGNSGSTSNSGSSSTGSSTNGSSSSSTSCSSSTNSTNSPGANLCLDAQTDGQGNINFTADAGQVMYFGTHMLQVPNLQFLNTVGAAERARIQVVKAAAKYPTSVGGLPFK